MKCPFLSQHKGALEAQQKDRGLNPDRPTQPVPTRSDNFVNQAKCESHAYRLTDKNGQAFHQQFGGECRGACHAQSITTPGTHAKETRDIATIFLASHGLSLRALC